MTDISEAADTIRAALVHAAWKEAGYRYAALAALATLVDTAGRAETAETRRAVAAEARVATLTDHLLRLNCTCEGPSHTGICPLSFMRSGLMIPTRAAMIPPTTKDDVNMSLRNLLFRDDFEPYEFNALATYNAERYRGIVHTPEWQEKMAVEQARFDEQQRQIRGKDIIVKEAK